MSWRERLAALWAPAKAWYDRHSERDRRIIAIHEWGHFLVDFVREREQVARQPVGVGDELDVVAHGGTCGSVGGA